MGKKQPQQAKQSKKFEVFISGIPYETTNDQLSEFIDSTDIVDVKMPKYQDSGRSLGYAHVTFSSKQAYEEILKKNGQHLGNRYLTIEPAKGEKNVENGTLNIPIGCKVLFVKNLPYEITQQQIRSQFGSCGKITDVRMARNWANRKFKGFVYIDYQQAAGVKKAAKKYHNQEFRGRKLKCDGVTSQMKKGYKKRTPVDDN